RRTIIHADRRMLRFRGGKCVCRHRWRDGAGNTRSNERNEKFLANLPDHLVRRNTAAAGTGHNAGGVVPSTLDQAVDVLEKTGGAFVLYALACQPSAGTLRPAVR